MKIVDGKRLPLVTDTKVRGFFGHFRFLSNFHMCDVRVCGVTYPSSEHAYVALKTTDEARRHRIAEVESPSDARKLGRRLDLRPHWDSLKLVAMRKVVLAKFVKNPDLADRLLATEDLILEETNNWGDTFWGYDINKRQGLNHLGLILMSVRTELGL